MKGPLREYKCTSICCDSRTNIKTF